MNIKSSHAIHGATTGLSSIEAQKRLRQYGPNVIIEQKDKSIFFQIIERFLNPIIITLLVIGIVTYFLNQISNFIIINIMVLISIALDFFQEYSANKAAKELRKSIIITIFVLRDGQTIPLPNSELVIGDIVFLKPGDVVPADGTILKGDNLYINQAILTGESFPVEMITAENVFMGTAVISGEGQMLVTATGNKTKLGEISASISQAPPLSSFEKETRKFGLFLVSVTAILVTLVLFAGIFSARPWVETLLFALALAVGMTPEFLPMVMSVALSRGAKILSKKKIIVKRLSAIHDLGVMNILCTDKTGTLTEAKIQLARHIDIDNNESEHVHYLAYLNSYFETGRKNPLDEAILSHEAQNISNWNKIDEIHFDFERKKVSVLVDNGLERIIVTKGAPENVLEACSHYELKGKISKITAQLREKLHNQYKEESTKGFRTLGIAWKSASKNDDKVEIKDECDLIFAGFASFYDPPKSDVKQVLKNLAARGIDVYVITGDSEEVTTHLCDKLNFAVRGVLNGNDLDKLSDEALKTKLKECNLFCRLAPMQKLRIVKELRELGFVVGYLGDGINDAPSLHAANIGISVNTGTNVAKEAADIILLRQNLGVVLEATLEGRKIFSNIIKYIERMTSSNFGNMFSMALASLFMPFLPMLPIQIILNNLLYDVSQTVIPFDNVDPEDIETCRKWDFTKLLKFMLVMGPLCTVFDLILFFILLKVLNVPADIFQTSWFIESLLTKTLIIFILRTRLPIFASNPHPLLAIMAVSLISIGVAITYLSIGTYFGFVHLPIYLIGVLLVVVLTYLVTAKQAKDWFYKFLIN